VVEGGISWLPTSIFLLDQKESTFLSLSIKTPHGPALPAHWPLFQYRLGTWNILAESSFIVRVAITTFSNMTVRLDEPDVVAFQVIDSTDGDSARCDYAGTLPGVVRPMLNWDTIYKGEVDDSTMLGAIFSEGNI